MEIRDLKENFAIRLTEIDNMIKKMMEIYDVPGVAVGIVQNGDSLYSKGFGISNLDSKKIVSSKTMFKTGSVSKVVTAIAVMQLFEEGKFQLEDEIYKYIPYFKNTEEIYRKVTIKHLLTHHAGVPSGYKGNHGYNHPEYAIDSIKHYIRNMHDKPFEFKPGEKYEYSNIGFVILSALIEEISGLSFEEYVKKNILGPAGIENISLSFYNQNRSNYAEGHVIGNDFKNEVNSLFPDTRWIIGADGYYASSDDMNKLSKALMKDFENNTQILLKKSSVEQMWTSQEGKSIGLCWNIHNTPEGKLVEHGGNAPGFNAQIVFFNNLAISVLANKDSHISLELAKGIIKIMQNKVFTLPPLSDDWRILKILQKEGIKIGMKKLRKIIQEKGDSFEYRSFLILALGIMQGTGDYRLEYAKVLLETLITFNPSNVYMNDFLAETYLRLAKKHYQAAFDMDSNIWGIKKMLEQLNSVNLNIF